MKQYEISVCILYPVRSLHFVPGLQSAVCILHWPDWYWCFFSSEPQVWTQILELEIKILLRLSWPLSLMCRLYIEELPSTMMELWLLYTNWRRMQMRGLTVWLPLMLFWVVTACVEMNLLRVPKVWTFRLLDSSWIFRSSEMWFEFLSFIEINFDFHWVGSMLDYFRSNGSQCNFRPRNTTSVHGRQLPSTVDNFRQHLVHHNTSFIAFSMNKLKMKVGISTKVEHTKWSVAFYQEGNCSLFIWRMLQWQQDYGSVSSVWIFWSTQISPN